MTGVKRISPVEAHELVRQGYTYVDVRSEPEFEAGHPAGSVNVPLFFMGSAGLVENDAFLSMMEGAFAKDAKLVIGCERGSRSLRAAAMLAAEGYVDVVEQRAGFDGARSPFGAITEAGWERAGLPVERGAPPGRGYPDLLRSRPPR